MRSRYRPRVLIADDHTLVAEACKNLLQPEFDVIAVVSDGRTLMLAAAELLPDVVITEISMPALNGLDAGEQIKKKSPSIKLVYLTVSLDPDVAAEAFRRGASAYVLKQCEAEELRIAVRRVLNGASYLAPPFPRETVESLLRSGTRYQKEKQISCRQREVLQMLAEGNSMKMIAYTLHIHLGTVAFHKYDIMRTLGITTTAGLLEYAIRHNMISRQR